MTRRHRLIALVAAGATLVSGCGSVASPNAVAQVNDRVLDEATLESLVTSSQETQSSVAQPVAPVDGEYPTTDVANAINSWVWNEAIRAELADAGVEAPEPTVGDPVKADALQADAQNAYDALAKHEIEREWTDAEIAARFTEVVCINAAVRTTEEDARALVDAFNSGTGFLEATDTPEPSGSPLGCVPPESVARSVSETLSGAGVQVEPAEIESLEPGQAVGPWSSEFGFLVLQRSSVDEAIEVAPSQFKGDAALANTVAHQKISVNSIYGRFTPQGLQPLGVE